MVIIIDDEPILCEVFKLMLGENGCECQTFLSPKKAIAFYEENHSNICFVFVDVEMPVMNGYDCIKIMQKINSGLKAIITTGHSKEKTEKKYGTKFVILQKPFNFDILYELIPPLCKRTCKKEIVT